MSSMQVRLAVPAAAVIVAAGLWIERKAQGQTEAVVWEYATVEALQESLIGNVKYSVANICYHTSGGCKWETVRVSVDRSGQINDAVAAASARLGERGWEAVASTAAADYYRPTILMKRLRRQEDRH